VELQRGLADLEAADVWVTAISNDPVGTLAQFCDEHGVTFQFLSDEGSAFIRELGILNTLIEPEDPLFGIPFPGTYLLDERGVVICKYFHREYQVREAPAFVLSEGFGVSPHLEGYPGAAASAEGVAIDLVLGAPDLKLRQRVNLHVRLTPSSGWSLTGAPAVEVAPGDNIEVRGTRVDGAEARIELLSDARDVESVPVDVAVSCPLRSPGGALVTRELRTRLKLPVGDLNRARRNG
jgi:hypothetical protein